MHVPLGLSYRHYVAGSPSAPAAFLHWAVAKSDFTDRYLFLFLDSSTLSTALNCLEEELEVSLCTRILYEPASDKAH